MAIEWLLPILCNARLRPQSYFSPIGHVAMLHWIHGLYTALSFMGADVDPHWKHRNAAVERRGLEVRMCWNEDELEKRGLTPAEVVDELLAIEIERCEAHRADILNSALEVHRKYYPNGIQGR